MSIHAITGVMGSGKSYEAVSEKIAPALKNEDGRRVVTNITGLNYQAIADFIGKPLAYVQAHLISVSYERPAEPFFWCDPEADAAADPAAPKPDYVVQPGDLVVLDEVWRYYNRGTKLSPEAMTFFRMHRHYVSPKTNLACDLVLVNQAMRGIHQDIRDIIEVEFNCRKLKALGRPQNYQVFVIEGGSRKASHQFLRKYSPKVFPLYSSYDSSSAGARESIDKRQSAMNKPLFKVGIPLALMGIVTGLWFTFHHFKQMGQPKNAVAPSVAAAAVDPLAPALPGGASSASVPGQPAPQAPTPPAPVQPEWRLVALYRSAGLPVAVMVDDKGRYRTMTSGNFRQGAASDDVSIAAPTDDKRITPWSGSTPSYVARPAVSTVTASTMPASGVSAKGGSK